MFFKFSKCVFLLTVILSTISFAQTWNMVWDDEFNGTEIDLSKWEHEVNGQGGGNNELQYYTARDTNSFIQDGKLVIRALKETYTGPDGTRQYTSARLRTLHMGDWKYGRFRIKAKLPYGQGLWPAIWMLPSDWVYGGWPSSGEIDIMELLGQNNTKVYGTLHYGGTWPNHVQSGSYYVLPSGNFSDDFHVFEFTWLPTANGDSVEMKWYVDDVLYLTQTEWWSSGGAYPAPFDKKFHMLLNVAVGGNWPGNPDGTTTFPQTMEIDYVRIYELGPTGVNDNSGKSQIPEKYELKQNYPNPFNPDTKITYGVPTQSNVKINIYNILGQVVKEYAFNSVSAGAHSVNFNASGLSSGVYVYEIQANSTDNYSKYYSSKKMIYLQ